VTTSGAFLSGRLPSGEANGLAAIVRDLIDDPGQVRVLVVLADAIKVTRLVESGDTVPTVRIRRIEAITDAADRESLRRLMMREFERRTGQAVLPLELEEDVRQAFDNLDAPPATDPPADPPADPPKRKR
jgi:hypothetical protein